MPLSDKRIVNLLLEERGISVLEKAVELHRLALGIPSPNARKRIAIKDSIGELAGYGSRFSLLPKSELVMRIQEKGVRLTEVAVEFYLHELGIAPIEKHPIMGLITACVNDEPALAPYTDPEIASQLEKEHGVTLARRSVSNYRSRLGIAPANVRRNVALKNKVAELIDSESPLNPRPDREVADLINAEIISAGRENAVLINADSVGRFRAQMGISSAEERKTIAVKNKLVELRENESPFNPYTDQELADLINSEITARGEDGVLLNAWSVERYRKQLGIHPAGERRNVAITDEIVVLIDDEDPLRPYTDRELADLLAEAGIQLKEQRVKVYRRQLGIPSSRARRNGDGRLVAESAMFKPIQFESNAQILDFFAENMEMLTAGYGIPLGAMAKAFNLSPTALGGRIGILQKDLVDEPEHFIHRIRSKPIMGIRYYSLPEQGQPNLRERVIVYLKINAAMLQVGDGIPAQKMASELGVSTFELGQVFVNLRKEFGGEHPMQNIKPNKVRRKGKTITHYFLQPELEHLDHDVVAGG